ncbi:MAG: hypothetical protein BJ554DRAFT_1527, partial [Olpidium bornovanus]
MPRLPQLPGFGQSALLVSNSLASSQEERLAGVADDVKRNGGSLFLEHLDRLDASSAPSAAAAANAGSTPLPPSSSFREDGGVRAAPALLPREAYSHVYAGYLPPPAFPHSQRVLNRLADSLTPGGRLYLREPVISLPQEGRTADAAAAAADLLRSLGFRTSLETAAAVRVAGLVDVVAEGDAVAPDAGWDDARALESWAERGCSGDKAAADRALAAARTCRLQVRSFTAVKPGYVAGASVPLRLALKRPDGSSVDTGKDPARAAVAAAAAADRTAAWSAAVDEYEAGGGSGDELEDEDQLLDGDDLVKPSAAALQKPAGCETKRKACKNCSCGRAEMELAETLRAAVLPPSSVNATTTAAPAAVSLAEDDMVNVVIPASTMPKSAKITRCSGFDVFFPPRPPRPRFLQCSLGDAFRCATCPFLGMPAFNPGEEVSLAGNM